MAAVANFTIDQGATFSSTVTVKDSTGSPLDFNWLYGNCKDGFGLCKYKNTYRFNYSI